MQTTKDQLNGTIQTFMGAEAVNLHRATRRVWDARIAQWIWVSDEALEDARQVKEDPRLPAPPSKESWTPSESQ